MRKKNGTSRSRAPRTGRTSIAPRDPSDAEGLLVVVELGATWPTLTEAASCLRRVMAQLEGESPAAFAERVASALDGLFGRGVRLLTVALACNERIDPAANEARRKLAGLALGIMAKSKSGKVYLTASSRSSGRLRHSLSALAQGLFAEWRTAGLEASVQFGEEARSSIDSAPSTLTARVA